MFSRVECMVAMRYLRPRRKEGFVSVIAGFSLLGIMLGVATLIIVMSVMNGFREELLTRILGLNGHLGVYSRSAPFEEFDSLANLLREAPRVESVTPMVEGQVMATANGVATGALVRGLRPSDFRKRAILSESIVRGSLDSFRGEDAIIIGERLANKLGVKPGERVTLISPQSTASVFGSVPRVRAYRVAATFDVGMFEYDSTFVFMPLEAAQIFFRMRGAVTGLELMIRNPDKVDEVRAWVEKAAGSGYRLYDWQQANAGFFNAIQVERNVMFLILTLIIIVAAFNIVSSMIMLVKDKGRDIAILRTMGATRGSVMRIFFLSGASIGVVGTFLGFVFGLAFSENIETIRGWIEGLSGTELFAAEIYFLSKLPAVVDHADVTVVVLMSLALSFLATLYPSWRAARLDPVEALRYE